MKIWYSINDSDHRFCLDGVNWDLTSDWHRECAAEDCADDFHSNHDGWERHWPVSLTLYGAVDGPAIASFEVECEMEPRFLARVDK